MSSLAASAPWVVAAEVLNPEDSEASPGPPKGGVLRLISKARHGSGRRGSDACVPRGPSSHACRNIGFGVLGVWD